MHDGTDGVYSSGDMLYGRCHHWLYVAVVCLLVCAGSVMAGTPTEFRNESAYPMQVMIKRVADGSEVVTKNINPGGAIQFDGIVGENYRPELLQLLKDGSWMNQTDDGIGFMFKHPSWGKWRRIRDYGPDQVDFAAGTTLMVRGEYRSDYGHRGIAVEDTPNDYTISTWSEQVTITVQNNTSNAIDIRPVDGDGALLVTAPGWVTVGAGMSQSGTFDSPWHYEITNDGGVNVWETPEPGVDTTYIVNGDGSGGLMLSVGDDSTTDVLGDMFEVQGSVPDDEPEELTVPDTPEYITEEGKADMELDRWDTGNTGYDYYWDNIFSAVMAKDWRTCAPSLTWDLHVAGMSGTINLLHDESGNVIPQMDFIRWLLQLICYVFTALVCLRLVIGRS